MKLLAIIWFLLLVNRDPSFALSGEMAKIPEVLLSKAHASMCHVKVGDQMPTIPLLDLDGQEYDPVQLIGAKATVVVFWQGNRPMTRTLLADLAPDVIDPYRAKGVAVVGVAIQQDAATTREQLGAAKADFSVLLDPNGTAFGLVGNQRLPRIYVLDAKGRIIWFDIEYSCATRRELHQTLGALVP